MPMPPKQPSGEDPRGNEVQLQTACVQLAPGGVNIGPAFLITTRMNIVHVIIGGNALGPALVILGNQAAVGICGFVIDGAPMTINATRSKFGDPLLIAPTGSTQLVAVGPVTAYMTITYYRERS
jgi:hypothetical protein